MSRYIDADEFSKKMKKQYCENCDNYQGLKCRACPNGDWLDDIDNQPTADVRENVRGEWIDRGKDMTIRWQCSECGRKDTHIYNFCPNCGADMRRES